RLFVKVSISAASPCFTHTRNLHGGGIGSAAARLLVFSAINCRCTRMTRASQSNWRSIAFPTRLLTQSLQSGMTVVDIGCNIGYFALLEAKCVGPTGKVIAIEPEPGNARLFLDNLRANGYRNVEFHQVAISDRNGTFPLRISEKSNRHSLGPVPWPTTGFNVPVRTLDSLIGKDPPESVDLVRMDLEGHEVEVLSGMRATIHRYSPKLLIEIH